MIKLRSTFIVLEASIKDYLIYAHSSTMQITCRKEKNHML